MSTHRVRRPVGADHETLLHIADIIDMVIKRRAALYEVMGCANPDADDKLRRALFVLLDNPTQALWEQVREVEVVPSFVPGLSTPSPLGLTLADIVYACGLPDVRCPSRADLLRALHAVGEAHGLPG
jgi:hypothetical protein